MNQAEMDLIKAITETATHVGELKGKIAALEDENKFLRELLKDKLAQRATDSTEQPSEAKADTDN